jgi:tetratricopeptide (TPR) repeat protein
VTRMHFASRSTLRCVPLLFSLMIPVPRLQAQAANLDEILGRAQSEQSSGRYAAAAADYAQATELDATVPELWANRGLMEYLAGQKPQAIASFRHALALKPTLLTPMLFLGKAYIETGKPEMALPLLQKARAQRPDDAEIQLALGDSYQALHDSERAASAYQKAAAARPLAANAWFGLGVSSLALIEDNGRVLAERRGQSIWARALYGDELFVQGRSAEAINTYEQAIHTATPRESVMLAKTMWQMLTSPTVFALPPNAVTGFERLLPHVAAKGGRAAPADCQSLREQAACAFWRRDFDRSAESAARLLAAAPTDPEALYWSIKANERRAVAALSKFEELAPHSAASSDMVGDLYRRQRQPDKALAEYQKALALDPHDPAAHLGMAAVYLSIGRPDGTIAAAQAGLADRPDDARLNLLMAEGLVAQHNFVAAKSYLRKSLSAPPELRLRVHALLGRIDADAGNTAEAICQLKLALPGDEDGSLHYQLYRLYLKTGNRAEAKIMIVAVRALEAAQRKYAVTAVESSLARNQ